MINGREALKEELKENGEDELALVFTVKPKHFIDGKMYLTCSSYVQAYYEGELIN